MHGIQSLLHISRMDIKMRANELYESESDQTANILLTQEIKRLRQLEIAFQQSSNINGYEQARTDILPKLNGLDSVMWLLTISIKNNIKLQKLYNNYLNERTNLINKINSGV